MSRLIISGTTSEEARASISIIESFIEMKRRFNDTVALRNIVNELSDIAAKIDNNDYYRKKHAESLTEQMNQYISIVDNQRRLAKALAYGRSIIETYYQIIELLCTHILNSVKEVELKKIKD